MKELEINLSQIREETESTIDESQPIVDDTAEEIPAIIEGTPPTKETVNDFISFKFFLNRLKGKIHVLQHKILTSSGEELFNSKGKGTIEDVQAKYFSVTRPDKSILIEFGKPSDWTFFENSEVIRATRRNGGILELTLQKCSDTI